MAITFSKPEERVGKAVHGSSVVLYGPPIIGKTSTLRNNPDLRVCLIDLDKNSGVVHSAGNITVIGADTFEELKEIRKGVEAGNLGGMKMDFDLYVIDSTTALEYKVKEYVVDKFAPKRRREIEDRFGAQSDWGDLQDLEVEEIREWHALTRRPKNWINVLWIGHDMTVTDSNGIPTHIQLLLQGKYAAPRIMSMMDGCFYMFKNEQVHPQDKTKKRTIRGIYTIDQGMTRSEARMDLEYRKNLPNVIVDPDWLRVFGCLNGQFTTYKEEQ